MFFNKQLIDVCFFQKGRTGSSNSSSEAWVFYIKLIIKYDLSFIRQNYFNKSSKCFYFAKQKDYKILEDEKEKIIKTWQMYCHSKTKKKEVKDHDSMKYASIWFKMQ